MRHAATVHLVVSIVASVAVAVDPAGARAAEFTLIVGVDAGKAPGPGRPVTPVPGPGFPGSLIDGDRLAGTVPIGSALPYQGDGVPMFAPNAFGALSFAMRRGSIPIGGGQQIPEIAIDFLGGPRLDLDGNLQNGVRRLVPVFGVNPVVIPATPSFLELRFDFDASTVQLIRLDATGLNIGAPALPPGFATTVNVLAGTSINGAPGAAINPSVDTRTGVLTGHGVAGVHRIDDLGYEFWQDSIDPSGSSAAVLGSFQFLGRFRGWLVVRDPVTGVFPVLSAMGLGSTRWPAVATGAVGQTCTTANGLAGGTAVIAAGLGGDNFTACTAPPNNCNGGVAMSALGGDLGAYFDQVVVPNIGTEANAFVYLESAGFGINNTFDHIFGDTVGWDVVIVASSSCGVAPAPIPGDMNGDYSVDAVDYPPWFDCAGTPVAAECMPADTDGDGDADLVDFAGFQHVFGTQIASPDCTLEEP